MKTIPNFTSYLVSNCGEIFSTKWGRLRKLRPCTCQRGYLRVGVCGDDGKRRVISVHLLVLYALVGEKPNDTMMGLHIDDNKLNNHVDNLKWGTFQDNMDDRVRNGKQKQGVRVWTAKLTPEEVREIRDLHRVMGYRRIAKLYGIKSNTVMYCVKRISWKGVE